MKTFYRLVIDAAGPGFHDRYQIVYDDLEDAQPQKVFDRHGTPFERYAKDETFVEIKSEYIVARYLIKEEVDSDDDDGVRRILGPLGLGDRT